MLVYCGASYQLLSNFKCALTLDYSTAYCKTGLDVCVNIHCVRSFMCLPLKLVLSGTPAAAPGSHNLGPQKSERP